MKRYPFSPIQSMMVPAMCGILEEKEGTYAAYDAIVEAQHACQASLWDNAKELLEPVIENSSNSAFAIAAARVYRQIPGVRLEDRVIGTVVMLPSREALDVLGVFEDGTRRCYCGDLPTTGSIMSYVPMDALGDVLADAVGLCSNNETIVLTREFLDTVDVPYGIVLKVSGDYGSVLSSARGHDAVRVAQVIIRQMVIEEARLMRKVSLASD